MKLTILLICVSILSSFGSGYSQNSNLNLKLRNLTLKAVLAEIEDQTEYSFLYKADMIDHNQLVDVDVSNASVGQILDILAQKAGFSYKIMENAIIVLTSATEQPIQAQQSQFRVTGKVTDSSGVPLPGVSVVIKGTTSGTITGIDGGYTLANISASATLVFSFVGMRTQEIAVAGKSSIRIAMEEDAIGIEEVVAVGYGTQKKVNLTGSIASINGEDLIRRKVAQTSLVLQGIAPGVVVTQSNGQPGRDYGTIRIRGNTTLGDNNPLILVDGVGMDLNNIDPTVIESISILKDAASASIYGSRAANGVILVTTKRARKDKLSVSYNGYVGWQKPTHLPDMVGAIDHMLLINEAYQNVGVSPLYSESYIQEYRSNMSTNPDRYPDTDWFGQVVSKSGFMQNHTVTMSGGTEAVRVMASFGYLDQNGIIDNDNFKRYTMRINSDLTLTKIYLLRLMLLLSREK